MAKVIAAIMIKEVKTSGRIIGNALNIFPAPEEAYKRKSVASKDIPVTLKNIKLSQ